MLIIITWSAGHSIVKCSKKWSSSPGEPADDQRYQLVRQVLTEGGRFSSDPISLTIKQLFQRWANKSLKWLVDMSLEKGVTRGKDRYLSRVSFATDPVLKWKWLPLRIERCKETKWNELLTSRSEEKLKTKCKRSPEYFFSCSGCRSVFRACCAPAWTRRRSWWRSTAGWQAALPSIFLQVAQHRHHHHYQHWHQQQQQQHYHHCRPDFNIPCHLLVIIIVYHKLWLLQSTSPPHNHHHDNHHHHHGYHLINDHHHNHPVHVHVQLYLRTPDVVCRQLWSRFPGQTQPWWTSLSLSSTSSSSSS